MITKVSELLKSNIHPLIHGALISRIVMSEDGRYFAAVSSYQKSAKLDELGTSDLDFDLYVEEYINALNRQSLSNNWIGISEYRRQFSRCNFYFGGHAKAIYLIENDLNLSKDSFFNQLYSKLFNECDYIQDENMNEQKKDFIRGFCELRGSIDTTRPLLAMDYFYDSIFELGKARLLNEYFSVPYFVININFRDLQNQFVSAVNRRNTQLRLQLNWYASNIGFINEYKVNIVSSFYHIYDVKKQGDIHYVLMPVIESRGSNLFIQRLSHFSSKIFGRDLSAKDIDKLREELGFDIETKEIDVVKRNKDIVELVRLFTDDICAGCQKEFDLKYRTFIHRKTGRPYFEIHHNISFSNTLELDHEDNLVKLCPVCHTCMKSGVGFPEDQKHIIENILDSQPHVKDFASHFFNTQNEVDLVNNIYNSLR
ncbi:MAG: HNH endonuclease [Acholeplasma sp.]|nr:HNH endonuclease [Acholeplasma sp.]